jgi:hypothetical protein
VKDKDVVAWKGIVAHVVDGFLDQLYCVVDTEGCIHIRGYVSHLEPASKEGTSKRLPHAGHLVSERIFALSNGHHSDVHH